MDKLPASFTTNFLELMSLVDCLQEAISQSDRANIVRSCSNIMYSISDLLEQAIPDVFKITITDE